MSIVFLPTGRKLFYIHVFVTDPKSFKDITTIYAFSNKNVKLIFNLFHNVLRKILKAPGTGVKRLK